MRTAGPFTAILLLLAATTVRGQAVNDSPDPAPQSRSTISAQRETPDSRYGLLPEPSFITKGVDLYDRRANRSREPKDGFYLEMGNMITGAGFLSAGPGYRTHVLNDNAIVSASG